jgi:signal transduction histidine kinase/putative methionine-R-sulfoxide reductase with GAF domain
MPKKILKKSEHHVTDRKTSISEVRNLLSRRELEIHSMQYIGKTLSSVLNLERLLMLVMDEVTKLMHAERGTLYLVDFEKGELWSKIALKAEIKEIRLKIGVGISGYVAQTGELINIQDAYHDSRFDPSTDKKTGYKTRSILCMPIREPVKDENQTGKIMAVIQILNKIDGVFTRQDEDLLSSLTSPIAIAIVNARLYSNLEDRLNELNLLFNLEKELSRVEHLDTLLKNLLLLVSHSLRVENGLILLSGADNKDFPQRYAVNIDETKLKTAPFSVEKGIIGRVFDNRQSYLCNNVEEDPYLDRALMNYLDLVIRNMVCSPLVSENRVIGFLILMNKAGEHTFFSSAEQRIMDSIAGQMARGIDNYRLREEKTKADRLATIGNMMSTIVHDLRTPMSNILGFVDLMQEEKQPGTRQEYADIINQQIKSLTSMTTDVLDFAKGKTTILPRKYPVDKLVKDFVKYFEDDIKRKGYNFEWSINTASMIYVDPEKINRIFMNIMKNALEAMKPGGTFSLHAGEQNGQVLFSLQDTGSGIPDEIKDKLFGSFVTSGKEGGTGLGLAIVKKVIDEHKGRIEVETAKGVGTTFKIYFAKI